MFVGYQLDDLVKETSEIQKDASCITVNQKAGYSVMKLYRKF